MSKTSVSGRVNVIDVLSVMKDACEIVNDVREVLEENVGKKESQAVMKEVRSLEELIWKV